MLCNDAIDNWKGNSPIGSCTLGRSLSGLMASLVGVLHSRCQAKTIRTPNRSAKDVVQMLTKRCPSFRTHSTEGLLNDAC